MIRTEASGITLNLNQDTLHVEIKAGVSEWKWAENFRPVIVTQEEVIDFSRWQEIVHETFESGVGKGIRSSYRKLDGAEDSYAFETSVWVEEMEEDCPGSSAKLFGRVHFEWIPICEKGLSVKEVRWPGCMEFDSPSQAWQTLVNEGQGLLIPNTWENEAGALSFNGRFLTAGGYMPWYGQVKDQAGLPPHPGMRARGWSIRRAARIPISGHGGSRALGKWITGAAWNIYLPRTAIIMTCARFTEAM